MKISDLTDAYLDYWTGRADGIPESELSIVRHQRGDEMLCVRNGARYAPSTDWSTGGPLIERESISTSRAIDGHCWWACSPSSDSRTWNDTINLGLAHKGKTLLESAMRCYVASKYGDEVPGW